MIPLKERKYQIEGNLDGESIEMSIDPGALQHVLDVLSNMYSDIESTLIREFCSNALDSHVEAGQTDPVELIIPNGLNQNLIIRDTGTGMSARTLFDIYSKYGSSTKRDSDLFTGMMGLGSKSGLAYCQAFNVKSIHDGVRILATVAKNEQGIGTLTIVDKRATDEPSGVEISIPAKAGNQFSAKAKEFCSYLPPGVLLLNGKEPEYVQGKQITPDILMVDGLKEDRVKMGWVTYPTPTPLVDTGYRGYGDCYGFVVSAQMGSCSFTPSREALQVTDRTKATLSKAAADIKSGLAQAIQDDVEAAPSKSDALTRKRAWPAPILKLFPNPSYKDEAVPEFFEEEDVVYGVYEKGGGYRHGNAFNYKVRLTVDHCLKSTFITGSPIDAEKSFSSHSKAKIKKWAEDNNGGRYFILCDVVPGDGWFEPETVTWDEIKAVKLKLASTTPRVKRTEKYDLLSTGALYGTGAYWTQTSTLDSTKPIYFYSGSEPEHPTLALSHLKGLFPDAQVVKIGINRHERFKKDWPSAIHLKEALTTEAKVAAAAITSTDRFAMSLGWRYNDMAASLPLDQIEDPDLAATLTALSGKGGSAERIKRYNHISNARGFWWFDVPPLPERPTGQTVFDRYPLIKTNTSEEISDSLLYISAKFRSLQTKKVAA